MNYILFFLTIICSVFSQHPSFLRTPIASVLKYSWILPFVYYCYKYGNSKYHKIVKAYFAFCIVFVIYDVLFVPKDSIKLDSDVVNILISFLVLVTSYLFWLHHRSERFLNYLYVSLLVSVIYLGFVIYVNSLSDVSLDDVEYAVASKNSIATIILSTIVLCSLNIRINKSRLIDFALLFCYVFLSLIVILLKSRATILGFVFFMLYISTKFSNRKVRNAIALFVIVFVCYLMCDLDAYDILVNKIFLNNRSADDLNALSSGRDEQIATQWIYFENSPLFGAGRGYIDSFPIQILVKYGIFGIIIMSVFLYKISKNIMAFPRDNMLHLSSYLLFCIFILNALFEAYPPFGPGIKCSFLWMSIGFSCAEVTSLKKYNENQHFRNHSYDE